MESVPDIALDILVDGGVRTFDVMPVADMSRGEWVRRETARRLFYLIYTIELLASVWTRRPLSHRERDLRIFLPLDESNFELAVMDRSIQRGECIVYSGSIVAVILLPARRVSPAPDATAWREIQNVPIWILGARRGSLHPNKRQSLRQKA